MHAVLVREPGAVQAEFDRDGPGTMKGRER
jgi:hypothetical protein